MDVFGHLFHPFQLLVSCPFLGLMTPVQCPALHISLPLWARILPVYFLTFCLLDVILEYGSYLADHGLSHPNSCQNVAEVKVRHVRTWQRKKGPSNRKVLLQNVSKPSTAIISHLKSQNLILLQSFLLTSELTLCKQADLQICLCRTVHPESAGCVSTLLVIQMFFSAGIVLTVQHSAAAPWGVSLVTCLTSTALTPRWAEAHNIFMMPTQALSGWMCLSGEFLWTFPAFL